MKRILNLPSVGALLGLSAFIGWLIINQLIPTWLRLGVIGTEFAPVGAIFSIHLPELIALAPLTILWVRALRSYATTRPIATALSSILLTNMLAGLLLAAAPPSIPTLPLRLVFFVAAGALVTPLVVRLFKSIKNKAYAGYAIIGLAILLPCAIGIVSFYMRNQLVLGY